MDQRLQQFNAETHQKTEPHSSEESAPPVSGQREQEAKGQGHDHIQNDLPRKIPPSLQNIEKGHQIHRHIGVLEDKGQDAMTGIKVT